MTDDPPVMIYRGVPAPKGDPATTLRALVDAVEVREPTDADIMAEENADNVRLLDWLAERMGLPHDEEVSQFNISAWLDRIAPSPTPAAIPEGWNDIQRVSAAAYRFMREQGFSGGWDHDEFANCLVDAMIAARPAPPEAKGYGWTEDVEAERAVGAWIYERIIKLMDDGAKQGAPEGRELDYLAQIVADVEEYNAPGTLDIPAHASFGEANDRLRAERDDLKTALHDLVMLQAQDEIGCVPPPTRDQWAKAWAAAEELVRVEE